MSEFRRGLAVLVTAGLVAAGCGGGNGDTTGSAIGGLSTALADTAEASTYRVLFYSGSTYELPAVGFKSVTDIDDQRPSFVGETSSGRQYFILDLAPILRLSLPGIGDYSDLKIKIWVDDERVVMDTASIQRLADANPETDFGLFTPGLFSVDFISIKEKGPEFLAALSGSSAPDLSELAMGLSAAFWEIEQTSTSPTTYVGTATYADLLSVLGVDAAIAARFGAAGFALNQPLRVDTLTEFFVDFFENTDAEVVIELDERGLLRVFSTRADMSVLFSNMFDVEGVLSEMSEQERQQAKEVFEGAVFVLETRIVYETDVNLEVPLPPETTEDRTEQWHQFLIDAGFAS